MHSDLEPLDQPPPRRFTDETPSIRASELYAGGSARTTVPVERSFLEAGGATTVVTLLAMKESVECEVVRWTLGGKGILTCECELRVSWSRPHYGRKRAWLHCPGCGERFALLYVHEFNLTCGACAGLSYRSKHDPRAAKAKRAAKIRASLGPPAAHGRRPTRPKGMHRKTFERRLEKLRELEQA